jgi:hypothetical protein
MFVAPPGLILLVRVIGGAASLAGAIFVFLLATKLYGTGGGIALGILTLVPLLGLIILLIINGKATGILKKHGILVGFLGAKVD